MYVALFRFAPRMLWKVAMHLRGPDRAKWLLLAALQLGALSAGVCRADEADEAPCAPAVQLEGSPRLVAGLSRALSRRGIVSSAPAGCPVLIVRLGEQGALMTLTMREERRRSERTVADLDTAVAVIDSFARSDISAPLLAAPPSAPLPPRPPLHQPSQAPAQPQPDSAQAPRLAVMLMPTAAVDANVAPWLGADLRLCTRLGPLCVGMLFRFAADLPSLRRDGLLDQRFASEIYATAELPLRLSSRFTFAPGVGLGAGWVRHRVHGRSGTPPPPGTSSDPDNDSDDYFDLAEVNDGGLRIELRLLLACRLGAGLALALDASGSAAPIDSPAVALVLGKDMAERVTPTPWGALHFGLGLRWSGP